MKLTEEKVKLAFKDAYQELRYTYPDPAMIPRDKWKFVKEMEPNKIYLWAFEGSGGMGYDGLEQDLIMITDKNETLVWSMSAPQRYRQDGNGLVMRDFTAKRFSRWVPYDKTITRYNSWGLSAVLDKKWIFGPIAEIKPTVYWLNWNQDPFEVK